MSNSLQQRTRSGPLERIVSGQLLDRMRMYVGTERNRKTQVYDQLEVFYYDRRWILVWLLTTVEHCAIGGFYALQLCRKALTGYPILLPCVSANNKCAPGPCQVNVRDVVGFRSKPFLRHNGASEQD